MKNTFTDLNDPLLAKQVIELHGGSTRLAEKLGFKKSNGQIRVNNWKTRGIPSKVIVNNPWLLDSFR